MYPAIHNNLASLEFDKIGKLLKVSDTISRCILPYLELFEEDSLTGVVCVNIYRWVAMIHFLYTLTILQGKIINFQE